MSDEKRVRFLWKAAYSLRPSNQAKKLLKSYYLTLCRRIARNKFQLPKEKFGNMGMCRKCSTSWFHGDFTTKVIPIKFHSSKAKKLVNELEKGCNLNKKQKNRAKWYRKKLAGNLEYTCKLCQHKTIVNETKTKIQKQPGKTKVIPPPPPPPIQRKKKKKKDKTAGLKITEAITKQLTVISSPKIPTLAVKSVKTANTVATAKKKPQAQIQNSFLDIKKHKNNQKSKPIQKPKVQMVSATKQKNTLLKLAEMLKKKVPLKNNSNNDRLKNLLR